MNSVLLPSRSLSLRRLTFRPFRPQPPCCHLPITAFARYLSRMGRRVYPPGRSGRIGRNAVTRSEVRHWLAGSPTGLAESGSLSYGLVIHLQLLPTPPRGDAVTFGYRFVTQTWWGLAPHRSNVFRDALAQHLGAGKNRRARKVVRPSGTVETLFRSPFFACSQADQWEAGKPKQPNAVRHGTCPIDSRAVHGPWPPQAVLGPGVYAGFRPISLRVLFPLFFVTPVHGRPWRCSKGGP
jgi:hypothetical protein